MDKRPLLFYSPLCEYSKDVLGMLIKKGIRERYILINVHKYSQQLPSCIQRVPCIITSQKQVIEDEGIMQHIMQTAAVVQQSQDLEAAQFGSGFCDSFAFIGDNGGIGLPAQGGHTHFSAVDSFQSIHAPPDEELFSKRTIDFESLKKERERDDKYLKENLPQPSTPY